MVTGQRGGQVGWSLVREEDRLDGYWLKRGGLVLWLLVSEEDWLDGHWLERRIGWMVTG